MTSFNLSELFETVADTVPDRIALATPDRRLTYRKLDERANRLAHQLAEMGVGPGEHVGLHLKNCTEYVECMLAAFKLRAVPVNINYRYVERELEYLYNYMDLVAVLTHREFVPAVATVAPRVPTLRHVIVVDDESSEPIPSGWTTFEEALAERTAERIFTDRSSDDRYCACTGGTTGLPKGVMWRHEDIFFAAMGGGDLRRTQGPITVPEQLRERVDPSPMTMLMLPPLMHVSAQWGTFIMLYTGGKAVFLAPGVFDAEAAWKAIEAEQVNTVTLVGNAMARPLLDYYAAHHPDASSLFSVGSGGAILSASTKARIHELLPHVIVADGFGSSETGVAGGELTTAVTEAREMPVFNMDATTTILDEDLEPLVPGDGRIGNLARRGHIPLGYYKDPAKTATTFVEKDGVRWVLPGDMATVESDGSIVLHGRGSVSINTGGEKVFPEEVETALLAYPAIEDIVVVGVPDEHWGERVVAVAKPKVDTALGLGELQRFARAHLAGYKVPRSLVTVDAVIRTPSGKPDYVWARDIAQSDDTHDAVPRPMEAT